MAQSITGTSKIGLAAFFGLDTVSAARLGISAPSREVIFLGVCLALLQVLDGILTAIGVQQFGTTAEGNFLIKTMMDQLGCVPALLLIKTIAIGVILCLCYLSHVVTWLETAMKGIIVVYIGAAIIPWSFILISKVL